MDGSNRSIQVLRPKLKTANSASAVNRAILELKRELAVRGLIAGMISSLNWQEAGTSERKAAFGLLTVAAFALVPVLTVTMN
jgi:hypothetical protein